MRVLLALAGIGTLVYAGTQSAPVPTSNSGESKSALVPTSSAGQNVDPLGQPVNVPRGNHGNSGLQPIITRPGVVDQGVKPLWRQPPPGNPSLPGSLTCTVVVNGAATGTYPFAWDGRGYRGSVVVGSSGARLVFLNVYRGHIWQPGYPSPIFQAGDEVFGWTVSPIGSGPRPGSAFYGQYLSVRPLRVDVPASLDWKTFVGGQSVRFVFTQ